MSRNKLMKLAMLITAVVILAGMGFSPAQTGTAHADYYSGTCDQPARLVAGGQGRVTSYPTSPTGCGSARTSTPR